MAAIRRLIRRQPRWCELALGPLPHWECVPASIQTRVLQHPGHAKLAQGNCCPLGLSPKNPATTSLDSRLPPAQCPQYAGMLQPACSRLSTMHTSHSRLRKCGWMPRHAV